MESHFPVPPSSDQSRLARERVLDDVRALVADGELLLHATADDLGEAALAARERLVAMIKRAKAFIATCQEQGLETARLALVRTENTVREHPLASIAAAAGTGLLIGYLLGRRSRPE